MAFAEHAAVFVGWPLLYSEPGFKGSNKHLLLDSYCVFGQTQRSGGRDAKRSKPVLTVAEPHAEALIYARRHKATSGQSEELIESTMKLA